MKKLLFIPLLLLFACGKEVTLNSDFIIVDSIKQNTDGSFEIYLKTTPGAPATDEKVHFTSKFRFQAGDTLWSRYQLKEYNINKITQATIENTSLKDSINLLNRRLLKAELENDLLKNHYITSLQDKK